MQLTHMFEGLGWMLVPHIQQRLHRMERVKENSARLCMHACIVLKRMQACKDTDNGMDAGSVNSHVSLRSLRREDHRATLRIWVHDGYYFWTRRKSLILIYFFAPPVRPGRPSKAVGARKAIACLSTET